MDLKKKKRIAVIGACVLLAAVIVVLIVVLMPPKVYINEICAANDGKYAGANAVKDVNGDYCDWIELYNPTDKDISLSDCTLSKDDGKDRNIGDFTIKAKDYLIVYCSKDGFEDDSVAHVKFNIGKVSESTFTLKHMGITMCSVTLPVLDSENSYSRDENGEMYISNPTPAAENDTSKYGDTPQFSQQSGMYSENFDLTITAGEGQAIFYTLDGTDPTTSKTRFQYTEPINVADRSGDKNVLSAFDPMEISLDYKEDTVSLPEDSDVDKATVVRAVAMGDDGNYGHVSTASYFIGITNADHSDMPIISIVTDPENLYDEETGIYVLGDVYEEYDAENPNHRRNGSIPANYNQRGREWERECYIEFFESDGSLKIAQDAGMRTQGGWSRAEYQKSFRFYARSDYGEKDFNYAFWGDDLIKGDGSGEVMDTFDTIVLRNGGNDTNYTKFKDIMQQDLVSAMDFTTQNGRPCVLFIDGEYWGFYVLQQDYNEEFFSDTYGVNESDVEIFKYAESDKSESKERTAVEELNTFVVNNDMKLDKNYKKFCSMVDVDDFAAYIAAECYMFNTDWPQNNYGMWRTSKIDTNNEYADGRWRFFMYDTDSTACMYKTEYSFTDLFTYLFEKRNTTLGGIIYSMLDNKEFSNKLVTQLQDCMNIILTNERVKQAISDYSDIYLEEMERYFKRFPTWANLNSATNRMLERMQTFYKLRPEQLTKYLNKQFYLSDKRTVSVSHSQGGSVYLDNYEVYNGFEGIYYDDCQITLTAKAEEGYVFDGWSGDIDGDKDSQTITISGDTKVTANFKEAL